MEKLIEAHKPEFEKIVRNLQEQLNHLRTGRASAELVEDLPVDAYGARTPLKQLAGISVSDAKTIVIQPWDRSISVNIEKAIKLSDIGINPVGEGGVIRLNIPSLTEERRKEIVNVLHQKLEAARIAARHVRDEIRRQIFETEKNKEITEDDKYLMLEEMEKTMEGYMQKIKESGEKKEKEVMTL